MPLWHSEERNGLIAAKAAVIVVCSMVFGCFLGYVADEKVSICGVYWRKREINDKWSRNRGEIDRKACSFMSFLMVVWWVLVVSEPPAGFVGSGVALKQT